MIKMQQPGVSSQYGVLPPEVSRLRSGPATDQEDARLVGMTDNPQPRYKPQPGLGDPSLAEAEAASPINSRPTAGINCEEIMPMSGELPDEDTLACYETDRGGGGGIAGGNRWPPQETLALLKIRSDMDAAFRDANLKGPLWEDVSRKLAELGYRRSAKKCREKFENVNKYYKRTKEGRAGRQDGKNYKFFNQLEALASSNTNVSAVAPSIMPRSANPIPITTKINARSQLITAAIPVSIGIGITNLTQVVSSTVGSIPPPPITLALPQPQPLAVPLTTGSRANALVFPLDLSAGPAKPTTRSSTAAASIGVSFSYDDSSLLSSSSSGSDNELDDEEVAAAMEVERDLEGVQVSPHHHQFKRKRKRGKGRGSGQQMMEFFEGLMKQVMQKQEVMQQRFLESIEKREQDRMIREEAWKRQEMARVSREHEVMAQERAMSASKDAAIIAFLQKITGQTIQLPAVVTMPATVSVPPQPQPPSILVAPSPLPQPIPTLGSHKTLQPQQEQQQQQQHYQQQQHQQQSNRQLPQTQNVEVTKTHQPSIVSSKLGNNVAGVPENHLPLSLQEICDKDTAASHEPPSSSRWPKVEVLALIKLRGGLESRYQESGPKGPLWEEISAAMQRMGYKRSAKRCKEKWENINKYFKKVKESNKKLPEDAKTCPYFHELDALHRNKILAGNSGGGSSFSSKPIVIPALQQQQQQRREEISVTIHPSLNTTSLQESSNQPVVMPSSQTSSKSDQNKCEGNSDLHNGTGGLTATLLGEGTYSTGTDMGVKKPEDIVKEKRHKQQNLQQVMIDSDKAEDTDSDNILDQDENYDDGDDDEEEEEEIKMAYR